MTRIIARAASVVALFISVASPPAFAQSAADGFNPGSNGLGVLGVAEQPDGKILVVGSHIEGMARRSQGAEAGDTSDEQSIDAVCPRSQVLLIRKDGDEDGRFTAIAKKQNIPMITFEKNLEIEGALKALFGR